MFTWKASMKGICLLNVFNGLIGRTIQFIYSKKGNNGKKMCKVTILLKCPVFVCVRELYFLKHLYILKIFLFKIFCLQ